MGRIKLLVEIKEKPFGLEVAFNVLEAEDVTEELLDAVYEDLGLEIDMEDITGVKNNGEVN